MTAKYDIFFSYARLSNGGGEDERGIVGRIVKELTTELNPHFAKAAEVFYDMDDVEAGDLSEQLENAVRSSTVFVLLLSRRYFHSEWCMRELEVFLETHGESAKDRVFILDNIPRTKFNPNLVDLPKDLPASRMPLIEFIDGQARIPSTVSVDGRKRALTTASLESCEPREFFKLIVRLGGQIAGRLGTIERWDNASGRRQETVREPPPPGPDAVTVMLGDSSENARSERDRLRVSLLGKSDIRLVPSEPNGLLYDIGNLTSARRRSEELMREAQLFIQVLGAGADDADETASIFTVEQLEAARKRGLTPLIWASKNVPTEDFAPHEQEILKRGGVERVTPREFREIVNSKVAAIAKPRPSPPSSSAKSKLLFFNGIGADRDIAQEAINASGRDDFDSVFMPLPAGYDKLEYDTLTEQNYAEADRSFIVGTEASDGWLPRQVRFYVRAQRNTPKTGPARVLKPARLSQTDIGFLGRAVKFHDVEGDRKHTVGVLAQLVREACDGR